MVAIDAYTPGHRLAWLARRLTQLDRPYLITGPQAAYEYHRWLTPLENVATLQVYTEDVPIWRQVNGEGCQVFETPPTTAQVQAVKEGIILDPTLKPSTSKQYPSSPQKSSRNSGAGLTQCTLPQRQRPTRQGDIAPSHSRTNRSQNVGDCALSCRATSSARWLWIFKHSKDDSMEEHLIHESSSPPPRVYGVGE